MTKRLIAAIAILVVLGWSGASRAQDDNSVFADENFSGTFGFFSDYIFRGISQTDREPAIQGSFDWAHAGSGLYLGAWASNVDFGDAADADLEVDLYGGITGTVVSLDYNLGFIYYTYPDSETADYPEILLSLGKDFGFASLTGSIFYSWDFLSTEDTGVYYHLGAEVPLVAGFSLTAHVGAQEVDDEVNAALPDYTDWSVGLAKSWKGFDFAVQYTDTDISRATCGSGNCEDQVVFSVSRSF